MAKSKFFVFEGIDACGKSTQIELLKPWLAEKCIKFFATKEPGGTDVGNIITEIAATADGQEMNRIARFFGFQMSRSLLAPKIAGHLARGYNVFCDRWLYSTIAYQMFGDKLPSYLVNVCNIISSLNLHTDRVYLIDLSAEAALSRCEKRDDIWFRRTEEYLKRVRDGYLELAGRNEKWLVIDGEMDKDEIQKCIRQDVKRILGEV